MASSIILKALGLNTSPNHLNENEGSLLDAINIIIRRDNVIESRRGYKLYGTAFGSSVDVAKQLIAYKDRIIRHYNNILQFDTEILNSNNESIFADFAGNYLEPEAGRRIRSIESNGNLYFTTSDGIKKLSILGNNTTSVFDTNTTTITSAGGIKAIDFQARLNITPNNQSGFLQQDSAVAYRIVWGTKDANGNLILGTPSERQVVYNPLLNLVTFDLNRVLVALDNINQSTSLINDGNYLSTLLTQNSAAATTLQINLLALAIKLDKDIVISNSTGTGAGSKVAAGDITMSGTTAVVTPSAGTAPNLLLSIGDQINIVTTYNMTTGTIPAGQYVITNVNATTFSFVVSTGSPTGSNTSTSVIESYNYRGLTQPGVPSTPATDAELVALQLFLDQIITRLQSELTGIIPASLLSLYIIPLDITTTADVILTINIPAGINSNYFLQIYRSAQEIATGTDVLNDLTPSDEMQLVYEAYPTAAELAAGVMVVEDQLIDAFRGAFLYTNAITGEGILNANDIPPLAKDINRFKNVVFYANTSTRQRLSLNLLGVESMLSDFNQGAVPFMGTITNFASVSGASVTNTGSSVLTGDLGVSPGSTVTGFPPGTFSGTLHTGDATAAQAQLDITSVYNDIASRSPAIDLSGQDLGGMTLTPGVYKFTSSAQLTGTLTLNAQGNSGALFIFQIASTLTTASSSVVSLINSANAGNVFWQVGSSATLGTSTTFKGNIFAQASITVTTSASVVGGLYARTGSVTLDTNVVTESAPSSSGVVPSITIATSPTQFNEYRFITGLKEITDFTFVAEAAGNYTGKYFTLNSANNDKQYYFWYFVNGSGADPTLTGKIGVRITINSGDTANQVATKTLNAIQAYDLDFTAVATTLPTIRVTNVNVGYTNDATIGTAPITLLINQQGRGELAAQEATDFTMVAGGTLNSVGTSNYFTLNTAFNIDQYYIWYQVGTSTDPSVANKTGIEVSVLAGDTAAQVATKTANVLNALTQKFIASTNTNILSVKNYRFGPANDATTGTMPGGFSLVITQIGALDVLLSTNVSPAQALDETSRSLVRIINLNSTEILYNYYLSGATDIPGKMLLEARNLGTGVFYAIANNSITGASFNPIISPSLTITNISVGNPTTITTSTNHGLVDGDTVIIGNTDSTPNIDGIWVITKTSNTQFTIAMNVTVMGSNGSVSKTSDAIFSANETNPNRIYYSKLQQPEAVPLLNYFDVGAQDKQILRIFPLRDSLFVFKEDGLFRISGEVAPFTVSLFDTSCICIAFDSVDIANNLIYSWTSQGIMAVSEAGASVVSRPIDIDILKRSTSDYIHFKTATWGLGYDSDSSYEIWTVNNTTDINAAICYRYCNLTNSWTTFDKSNTCGIINKKDDKMYLGAGDTNFIEQERKAFTRKDYADREIASSLSIKNYLAGGSQIRLSDISKISIGDALYQLQYLTIYEFNSLLQKLDIDPGVADSNYYSVLFASGGDDLRDKLKDSSPTLGLAAKLDADSGVTDTDYLSTIDQKTGSISNINIGTNSSLITTSLSHGLVNGRIIQLNGSNTTPIIDGIYEVTIVSPTTFTIPVTVNVAGTTGSFTTVDTDFRDIKACFDELITKLNNDAGVAFDNYIQNNTTSEYESIITDINKATKQITVNLQLPYIVGNLTIFNHINCKFRYAPVHMGDPLGLKHLREATIMFENKAFTSAVLSFASDLLPKFNDVTVVGTGNGLFGNDVFGNNYFGGGSHAAPFRTYIPRDAQRCRFLNIAFTHAIAREQFSIFGITLTGEIGLSTRAYR